METETGKAHRLLTDVSDDELIKAVTEMSIRLGIKASANVYSLYEAVLNEKKKMLDHRDVMENDGKE